MAKIHPYTLDSVESLKLSTDFVKDNATIHFFLKEANHATFGIIERIVVMWNSINNYVKHHQSCWIYI